MTATVLDTNILFTQVSGLAECLCEQIKDPVNGVPDVCSCGVAPGDNMAPALIDGDCSVVCGAAWVRVSSIYPMKTIGTTDTTPGNCGAGLGADIELGIMRCITVGDERGAGPTSADLLAAAQLQYADALVMRKAVLCCDAFFWREAIMTTYTPLGPGGGMVGGTWMVQVGIG
jgi:hypothetical protein